MNIVEVHGHEVLRLLLEAAPPLSREALEAESLRIWGPDAVFYTCSGSGMSLPELVEMLLRKGKIMETASGLEVDLGRVCSAF